MERATARIGVPPLDTMKTMSGLDFLRGIVEGTLPAPPITETLGFTLAEVTPGFARAIPAKSADHCSGRPWAGQSCLMRPFSLSGRG
jgi:hypothetical protein